ncbi:YezD family protein [Longimicrobium sp.]|uniref:YezD family protein n=1 Tax=Longimicrobium sp. TaxID=2029185 RepID=UPI002C80F9C6|nr:YezD family protein [Longimicrobium sp.]HSU16567.1 YezD family protein [Longimicrobium sp.]
MSPPATSALRAVRDGNPQPVPTVDEMILEAVRAIRFGTVQITIHDSRVVQIERTEKVRVTKS